MASRRKTFQIQVPNSANYFIGSGPEQIRQIQALTSVKENSEGNLMIAFTKTDQTAALP